MVVDEQDFATVVIWHFARIGNEQPILLDSCARMGDIQPEPEAGTVTGARTEHGIARGEVLQGVDQFVHDLGLVVFDALASFTDERHVAITFLTAGIAAPRNGIALNQMFEFTGKRVQQIG